MVFSTKGVQVNDFFKRNNWLINNLITIQPREGIFYTRPIHSAGPR